MPLCNKGKVQHIFEFVSCIRQFCLCSSRSIGVPRHSFATRTERRFLRCNDTKIENHQLLAEMRTSLVPADVEAQPQANKASARRALTFNTKGEIIILSNAEQRPRKLTLFSPSKAFIHTS
jgi:hypothetical protein